MPTLEERLQTLEQEQKTLEQEQNQLKKTIELQTIVIGALVNKSTLEELKENNNKIFDALIAHDQLTNRQLVEIREQLTEEDGKIVGLRTEMRHRFAEQDQKMIVLDGKVVGLQTEMRQRFNEQDNKIAVLDGKVAVLDGKVAALDGKVAAIDGKVAAIDGKVAALQTEMRQRFAEHTSLLQLILARLPEQKS